MSPRSPVLAALLVAAACAPSLFAQMNLNGFYSRDVKQAINVGTRVDSVQTVTTVGSGIATTIVTMVVTPVPYNASYYGATGVPRQLDSIEMTLSFWLPADFVARNMWLWVNGQPQTAYIQDRTLASEQYSQIVGKRKDPALLESWGNGSFNFRMFPASLNVSRKVAIEFQHTFDDDSAGLITAHVPLCFDSAYWNYSYATGVNQVKAVQVTVATADQESYRVTMPGLGGGTAAPGRPLVLTGAGVHFLATADITAADPSGSTQEFFWSGQDQSQRTVAGFATVLAESTVTLDPEPDTRVIVLDVRQRMWDWDDYQRKAYAANNWGAYPYTDANPTIDVWVKAQKYAVLCLQNYVKPGQKFNVIFAGAQVRKLFALPAQYSTENLEAAYRAIVAASPDPSASTEAAMSVAVAQAGKGVAILVSDLYPPYDYWACRYDSLTRTYTYTSPDKAPFDTMIARIGRSVSAAGSVFFTICDAWQLSSVAQTSGGYGLAGLRYPYYYELSASADYAGRYIPQLPKLFGSNNWSQGLCNLAVSGNLDSIAFTTDGSNNWWGPYLMVDGVRAAAKQGLARSRSAIWRPYYGSNQATIRVAGFVPPTRSSALLDLTITGRLGGLGFTKRVTGSWSPSSAWAVSRNVQWASVRAEQLANGDWYGNEAAIKKLGIDHHIVTRQTALLALEPGMELWPDTNSQSQGAAGATEGRTALSADMALAPSTNGSAATGSSLDSASLEDLIAMNMAVRNRVQSAAGSLAGQAVGSLLRVRLPEGSQAGVIQIALYDLAGRMLHATKVARASVRGNEYTTDLSAAMRGHSAGYYILKVRFAGQELKLRIMPR